MDNRLSLHEELLQFVENVYYQPPDNIRMSYPCIVYHKTGWSNRSGNNDHYIKNQQWTITLIDTDPDSLTAEDIEKHFEYCSIQQYFKKDNLSHTTLRLYY